MTEPADRRYPGAVLRTASDYGWRILVLGIVVYFGVELLGHLTTVVVPFILALLVTALLRPLLNLLIRHNVHRGVATVMVVVLAVLVVGGILTLVVIKAIDQAPQLGDQVNQLIPKVKNWLITGPFHVDRSSINNFSSNLSSEVSKNSSALASTALSTGKTALDVVTGLVLALFATIFLLYDGEGVWRFLLGAVPRAGRDRADGAGRAAWSTLGHYVRGTLVVAAFHGLAIATVLLVLGVPLVAPLAVLVAIGSFVPLVGAVVTGVVAAGVATLEQGLAAGIVVVIVLVVDNQVEAHLLQPFVVGRYVRIHPLATVLALATGAILFGIFGAIVAVPVVACTNSAVRSLIQTAEPQPAVEPERVEEAPGGA